jgi:acetyl-CoA carboxylase biotin carboxyl carrier protein
VDLRKIKTLIELLEASDLSEIEISEGDDSIRLSRASAAAPTYAAPLAAPVAPAAAPPAAAEEVGASGHGVESPTVGTFYSRSGPDAEPFVKVGDKVSVGTTLCVVEAMKTFNEIQADKAGSIVEIAKQDGDPVEFGEVLFVIA